MNKIIRNYILNIFLFLLLGIDIALVAFLERQPAGAHPSLGWHVHIFISILLTFGCLLHIGLHWRWYYAVLTGKAKGRMKLITGSLVIILVLLADLSGHTVLTFGPTNRLHSMSGYFALIGMSVHAISRIPWMASVTRRLVHGGGQYQKVQA